MHAKRLLAVSGLAAGLLLVGGPAAAKQFFFTGHVITCTPTCNSFSFLGPDPGDPNDAQSELNGYLEFDDDAIADGKWVGSDITNLSFDVFDPAHPIVAHDPPDPTVDNPFTIDPTPDGGGVVVASGQPITNPRGTWQPCVPPQETGCVMTSAGTTDGITLTGGFVDLWLTQGLLANNGAVIHIDLAAGTFTVNIFENAINVASGNVSQVLDTDGDGLLDNADNCINDANDDQRDTDGDGIGNVCDADFDQSCTVNFLDLGEMKANFFLAGDLDTDMNGDGFTNFTDLGALKGDFFLPPGPSGVPNVCSP